VFVVIPFERCIARPAKDDRPAQPLVDHLRVVASAMGDRNGSMEERLLFLAGLLHDAGKADERWQGRFTGTGGARVPHAPLGSALFTFCAGKLLSGREGVTQTDKWRLRWTAARLARKIQDHHGRLEDLGEDRAPWALSLNPDDLKHVDVEGAFRFVRSFYPELSGNASEFAGWLWEADEWWRRSVVRGRAGAISDLHRAERTLRESAAICLKKSLAAFITGDRLDAGGIEPVCLTRDAGERALERLEEFCSRRAEQALAEGADRRIVDARIASQEHAVKRYLENADRRAFTLTLPTGLGKTVTSLRVALTSAALEKCRRVVYVAPYLSILSHASDEIRKAGGLDVLEHHHLSTARRAADEKDSVEELLLESWQSPVVTTTFNQFFRALFPARAQQAMRLSALEGAFVVLDEPQIVDAQVWNLLLTVLEGACAEVGLRFMLTTATLPPLEYGLVDEAVPLGLGGTAPERYVVRLLKRSLDERGVAAAAEREVRRKGCVAVIMNTVRDAAEVYRLAKEELSGAAQVRCLTGAMTSLHKRQRIKEVKRLLGERREPVAVVCTQVLEAGVDLSFRSLLRARPVIPSIVQAAGRVNRHGEAEPGDVLVFDFLRGGETDTRKYVYRQAIAREETDSLLEAEGTWTESAASDLVSEYYRRIFERNPHTTRLDALERAAAGEWSALAGLEPFTGDPWAVPVFVPFMPKKVPDYVETLLKRFAPGGPKELFERYVEKGFLGKLDFLERKRFMALLQHFTVSLSERAAKAVAGRVAEDRAIWRVLDEKSYSADTGFAGIEPGESAFMM